MEHTPISMAAQRISRAQGLGIPCIPRPVSHSVDYIKPLLTVGRMVFLQMVQQAPEVEQLIGLSKYAPVGERTYGVNRAQGYGLGGFQ